MRAYASFALAGALILSPAMVLPAAAAGAPAWNVDKAHSKLGFESAYGGTKFNGSFNTWSAAILFDPANLAASKATVTIDLASAETGDDDRDQSLPSPDWFNTMKFPKATFTTSSIKSTGPGAYEAAGIINLKGVSKPATLNFTLKINGKQAVMVGKATVDRTQWGIGQGQFQEDKPVPHAVVVDVNITANRAG